MKYELEPWNRGMSEEEILADLRRVAGITPEVKLTIERYETHGKFHPTTVMRRFDGWNAALDRAGLARSRRDRPSPDEASDDLKRVASVLGVSTLTTRRYEEHGRFSAKAVADCHGGWLKALAIAGLAPSRTLHVTDRQWFENVARVWEHRGRQPMYNEMGHFPSRYSPGGYERRFGGWRKALHAFVAYMESEHPDDDVEAESTVQGVGSDSAPPLDARGSGSGSGPRNPNYRLRYLVFRRDRYTCRACGRSPATHAGVVLEADHIVPWPRGKTALENLQTLCQKCNGGKSNLDWTPPPPSDL